MSIVEDGIIITCVILACISSISSGIVIWAHFKIPQLHKHPGQMIVIICLIQMIFDLHWIAVLKTLRDEGVRSGACKYFAMIFNVMIFISWNVLSCLVLELVIKIKKPLSTNYSSRNKIYIISTVLITIAEFSPMLYFGGFGLTDVDTCFVQDGTISYWFALIPVFVNVPCNLVGFIILKCSEGYNRNKALQKMVRACFSMCITWGYPIFTAGMRMRD